MARLERAIRDAEARCSECAAVLEMKVQACSSLGSELQLGQERIDILERKLGRLNEASSSSEQGSVGSDADTDAEDSPVSSAELRAAGRAPNGLCTDWRTGADCCILAGSPLDGLAATQQSLERSSRRVPLSPVTPNMPIPAEASSTDSRNAGSSGRVSSSWLFDAVSTDSDSNA